MSTASGTNTAAIQVLKRAIQLDQEGKFGESLACYEQGIRLLKAVLDEINEEQKKKHYENKIVEYLNRAEIVKNAAAKQKASQKHTQIHLNDGDVGNSFEKLFGHLIDDTLLSVKIEDAYIRSTHQIYNFLHFCELLVKKAPNLRKILLNTSYDTGNRSLQMNRLEEIKGSLAKRNICLTVCFSDTLHDREIRFDNGWVVKIGRGLDIYKRAEGQFSIGFADYDLRPCHETKIDVFHADSLQS